MTSNEELVVAAQHLDFSYGGDSVLRDVSFVINQGDYVGIVGHNGSGKTTLIKLLLGLFAPESGQTELFSVPVARFHHWQWVGYVPQHISVLNPLFPATVEEVVALGLLSLKHFPKKITQSDRRKVHALLSEFNLADLKHTLIGDLSGGQQQRVFLARALITQPKLLILDEPSSSLDAASRTHFFTTLKRLNSQEKTTILLITHDIHQLSPYANRLLYLNRTVAFDGPFDQFHESVLQKGVA